MASRSRYANGYAFFDEDRAESIVTQLWRSIINLPVIREWRIARDAAFLVTSFPMGLAYFLVAVTGLVIGIPTAFMLVGLVVLAIMFSTLSWLARIERARLNVFLNAGLPEERRVISTQGSIFSRIRQHFSHPDLGRELLYGAIMFPLGIAELALVYLPVSYLMTPVTVSLFGSAQPGFAGWTVNNPFEVVVAMMLGFVLIVPVAFAVNIVAKLHRELARNLLG